MSQTRRRGAARPRSIGLTILKFVPLVVLLVVWQVGSGSFIDSFYFSSPLEIVERLYTSVVGGELWDDTLVTTSSIGLGYLIGAVAGVVLGYVLAKRPTALQIVEPYLVALQAMPKTALAPLFIIWLGIGIWSKVVIAALMVFFLVFYNTLLGMRELNQEFVNLARIMGASEAYITRRVVWPSIASYVLTGLKVSLPYALIGVLVGEFIAARAGLGVYILQRTTLFDPAGTFVGIIWLLVIVGIGVGIISLIERRVLRWRPSETQIVTAG